MREPTGAKLSRHGHTNRPISMATRFRQDHEVLPNAAKSAPGPGIRHRPCAPDSPKDLAPCQDWTVETSIGSSCSRRRAALLLYVTLYVRGWTGTGRIDRAGDLQKPASSVCKGPWNEPWALAIGWLGEQRCS